MGGQPSCSFYYSDEVTRGTTDGNIVANKPISLANNMDAAEDDSEVHMFPETKEEEVNKVDTTVSPAQNASEDSEKSDDRTGELSKQEEAEDEATPDLLQRATSDLPESWNHAEDLNVRVESMVYHSFQDRRAKSFCESTLFFLHNCRIFVISALTVVWVTYIAVSFEHLKLNEGNDGFQKCSSCYKAARDHPNVELFYKACSCWIYNSNDFSRCREEGHTNVLIDNANTSMIENFNIVCQDNNQYIPCDLPRNAAFVPSLSNLKSHEGYFGESTDTSDITYEMIHWFLVGWSGLALIIFICFLYLHSQTYFVDIPTIFLTLSICISGLLMIIEMNEEVDIDFGDGVTCSEKNIPEWLGITLFACSAFLHVYVLTTFIIMGCLIRSYGTREFCTSTSSQILLIFPMLPDVCALTALLGYALTFVKFKMEIAILSISGACIVLFLFVYLILWSFLKEDLLPLKEEINWDPSAAIEI